MTRQRNRTHRVPWRAFGLGVLFAACLAGCMGATPNQRDMLTDDVRGFHDGLRWRRFGDTAGRMLPEARTRFLERIRKLQDDFQVDDYEVIRTEPMADGRVVVTVVMEWESRQAGVLRKSELSETWQRMGKRWYMVEPKLVGDVSFPLLGLSAADAKRAKEEAPKAPDQSGETSSAPTKSSGLAPKSTEPASK